MPKYIKPVFMNELIHEKIMSQTSGNMHFFKHAPLPATVACVAPEVIFLVANMSHVAGAIDAVILANDHFLYRHIR